MTILHIFMKSLVECYRTAEASRTWQSN